MPLAFCDSGKAVEIIAMRMEASEKRRLENLGFVIGGKLTPLLDRGGVMLVALGSSRVALNKAVAQKILVK